MMNKAAAGGLAQLHACHCLHQKSSVILHKGHKPILQFRFIKFVVQSFYLCFFQESPGKNNNKKTTTSKY